jgi:hypothetical protein
MMKLKTKPPIKLLSIIFVLLLTASAASAACSYQHGKHYYNDNYEWNNSQYSDCRQYSDWDYKTCNSGENTESGTCNQCPDWNCATCNSGERTECGTCNQCPDWNCATCNSEEITDSGTTDPGTTDPGTTDPGITDPGTTDPGTTDNGSSVPPVTPTDATGTTTVKLCRDNTCTVGGNGQTLTLTNYNNAVNPTYDQLLAFLEADKTDERPYTSTYVCSDFAKALHDNAEAAGIKAGWVGAIGANHAFNVFETTDKGTVYIDCTGVPGGATLQDKQLNVAIGQPLSGKYLFRQGTLNGMEGTVSSLLVYW